MDDRIKNLKEGDYIAFPYTYFGDVDGEWIEVAPITLITDDGKFLVHFLCGHHNVSEYLTDDDIVAIGNLESGESEIRGWSGKFDIVQSEHPVLLNQQDS